MRMLLKKQIVFGVRERMKTSTEFKTRLLAKLEKSWCHYS